MRRPIIVWGVLGVLYLGFVYWYTSFEEPLTDAEIEHYLGMLTERGGDEMQIERLRAFLAADTGDDFAMLNVIEFNDPPSAVDDAAAGETASQVLDRYMAYMWPALLSRACHPVAVGNAAAEALDVWGIDGADTWSQAALMRYRSRRDLMEIASNPAFAGPHAFKIAAMAKTIAFPIDPWRHAGDPRVLLALVFAIIGLLTARRRGAAR